MHATMIQKRRALRQRMSDHRLDIYRDSHFLFHIRTSRLQARFDKLTDGSGLSRGTARMASLSAFEFAISNASAYLSCSNAARMFPACTQIAIANGNNAKIETVN